MHIDWYFIPYLVNIFFKQSKIKLSHIFYQPEYRWNSSEIKKTLNLKKKKKLKSQIFEMYTRPRRATQLFFILGLIIHTMYSFLVCKCVKLCQTTKGILHLKSIPPLWKHLVSWSIQTPHSPCLRYFLHFPQRVYGFQMEYPLQ